MKKTFIWSICSTCNEPVAIIEPCKTLGYNAFPTTNFHGELDIENTEKLRQDLIKELIKVGNIEEANFIENNTKVLQVEFK
jgi:hypothetical protein